MKHKIIDNNFIKFIDGNGNILYKQNGFDMQRNKLVGMNIRLYEDEVL